MGAGFNGLCPQTKTTDCQLFSVVGSFPLSQFSTLLTGLVEFYSFCTFCAQNLLCIVSDRFRAFLSCFAMQVFIVSCTAVLYLFSGQFWIFVKLRTLWTNLFKRIGEDPFVSGGQDEC